MRRFADAVQASDVYRVAKNLLKSKPVLAGFGNLDSLMPYDQYCAALDRAVMQANQPPSSYYGGGGRRRNP